MSSRKSDTVLIFPIRPQLFFKCSLFNSFPKCTFLRLCFVELAGYSAVSMCPVQCFQVYLKKKLECRCRVFWTGRTMFSSALWLCPRLLMTKIRDSPFFSSFSIYGLVVSFEFIPFVVPFALCLLIIFVVK